MRRRKAIVAFATLAVAGSLAGCGPAPLPEPSASPAPETPVAVLDAEQLDSVLAKVGETLAAADAAADGEQLAGRVTGPAATMRRAEYQLAADSGGANTVTPLVTEGQVEVVAATDGWPRTVMVITTIPEETNLPLLLTLVQQDARANYQLWSWVRLLPGVQMPSTANPAVGSPVVPADSDQLVMTPAQALERYVDVLNRGSESEFAASFAQDAFRTGRDKRLADLNTAVAAAGSATQSATVNAAGTWSLGTHDGGAIVVGAVDQTLAVKRTVAGSTLRLGTPFAFGASQLVEGTIAASYLVTVAFYVPPSGSAEPVQVLGAEQVLTGTSRDDSTSPD